PQWARRALAGHGPVDVFITNVADEEAPGKRVQHLADVNITLADAICAACNNGWLSRLESAVQPFLEPMTLRHQRTELDRNAQADLATWAVKTVLLLELAVRQRWPGFRSIDGYAPTGPELAWLYAERRPAPRSLVWLTCWDCQLRTPLMFEPSGAPLPAR